MKSFELVQNVLSVLVMALFGVIIGLAMVPSYLLFIELTSITNGKGILVEAVGICVGLGLGYIIWGVVLLVICGLMGGLFRIRKEEGRYSLRSFITIQWAFSLVSHRVAQIFLGLVVPSFLANLYYRMMGAKIGRGAQLNSMMINEKFSWEVDVIFSILFKDFNLSSIGSVINFSRSSAVFPG